MKSPSTRKLQIFVSSTYLDLRAERQAAVQAILETGNIPAGMELFAAGNEEQMQVIRRWIDQSDIFVLILGARYGSIEPASGKSYTHLEYEYAIDTNKPFFAVVLSDAFVNNKIRAGESIDGIIERSSPDKFNKFKSQVTSKLCKFAEDQKDIRIAVAQSIGELERRHELVGWVSGHELLQSESVQSASAAAPASPSADDRSTLLPDTVFSAIDAPFDESAAMREVRHRASRLARSELAMVLDGEPGTGRRTLAAALARQRAQRNGGRVFVLDGIEGITEKFRSALHSAVAFPVDVLCHHLEALPEKGQAELAKYIHARQVRLVGVRRVDPSVEDANSRTPTLLSPDLTAELKSTRVTLPPLRDRGEDIPRWAQYLLSRATERLDASERRLSRGALTALLRHRWPGNLIELDAIINRALCLTSSPEITAADLGLEESENPIEPLKDAMERFQTGYIDRVLAHFSGNRTQAAKALRVDVRTVFRHLERQNK